MRLLGKILTAGYLFLPLVAVADSNELEQALDSTKNAAKDRGQVAKQKLQEGEAAAKENWPKIQAKTQQELEQAKQKLDAATNSEQN